MELEQPIPQAGFGEVAEKVCVRARLDGRLHFGGHGVGLGRGLSGVCPRLGFGLQGGQLLLGVVSGGLGLITLLADLQHLVKGDGVFAVPRQDHGVVRGLFGFRNDLCAISAARSRCSLLFACGASFGGAFVIRCSGGRGRATSFRLVAGIARFRQCQCLGGLLRRQCAVDSAVETLV